MSKNTYTKFNTTLISIKIIDQLENHKAIKLIILPEQRSNKIKSYSKMENLDSIIYGKDLMFAIIWV